MNREADLVRKAVAGERDAFGSLYDLYERPVFLTLVGILRVREDAEDALQAAFLSAWKNLPRLRRPERFAPWLFRIARNKARDRIRAKRALPVDPVPGEDLIDPWEGSSSGEEIERLLAPLRPETRSLVLLRAVHGWSTEEVAAALGRSPATIRRRYARALLHLKNGLERGDRHGD